MRALHLIVWLLVSRALVFGQLAVNTNSPGVYPYPQPLPNTVTAPAASQLITGPVARSAYSDKGPAVWDVWVGGGYQPAATIADRNAIQLQRRKEGMLCWVKADNRLYRVGSDISNAGWVDLGILNGSATLYTTDGSITGSRTVDLGLNNLSFTGGGNVGVGVAPGSATGGKLDVSGTLNLRPSLIGNFPSSGSISVGFVNANSVIMINQTTPGIVLSIAPPTPSVAGRILTVINIGTEILSVSGVGIQPPSGASFVWSGSAWIQTSGRMGSFYENDGVFSSSRTATIPTAATLTFSGPGSVAISPTVAATLSSASSTIIGSSLMKFITPSVSAGTSAVGRVLTLSSTNGTVDFQAIPTQSTLYTADGTIPSLRTINNVGGMTISGSGAFTFVSGTQARFGTSGNFITATPAGGISAINSNLMNFESNDLTLTGISSLRIRTLRVNDAVSMAGETLISQDANGLAEWAMKGFVPAGGTTGQILTKTSGTDYASSWQTPSASIAAALTLTGTTLATNVTASSLLSAAGGTFGSAAFLASASIGSVVDVQEFTTAGSFTWTKPSGVPTNYITRIYCIGGGGGGAGGSVNVTPGTAVNGGGGGGPGVLVATTTPISFLATTEPVVVGAAGAGGASAANGTAGGSSSFSAGLLTGIVALGGNFGTTTAGGAAIAGWSFNATFTPSSGATPGLESSNPSGIAYSANGGGAGGGITVGNTVSIVSRIYAPAMLVGGAAAITGFYTGIGIADAGFHRGTISLGALGGGASLVGVGFGGGAGFRGSGGGGGGASRIAASGGPGGAGGAGYVRVEVIKQ